MLAPHTSGAAATLAVAGLQLPDFLDPAYLVSTFGLVGLFLIVFAETGLLFGIVLPGDSLLFLAGFAAAGGIAGVSLPIAGVLAVVVTAALLGAQTGWFIGKKTGDVLFDRPDSRFFKNKNVDKTRGYLERFGTGRAIVVARFVPVVRTLLNPLCGVVDIPARTFAIWNAVGAVVWGAGVPLAGYALGRSLSEEQAAAVDRYILPGVLLIILLSVLPIALEFVRERNRRITSE